MVEKKLVNIFALRLAGRNVLPAFRLRDARENRTSDWRPIAAFGSTCSCQKSSITGLSPDA
jgi:hypothetical protein